MSKFKDLILESIIKNNVTITDVSKKLYMSKKEFTLILNCDIPEYYLTVYKLFILCTYLDISMIEVLKSFSYENTKRSLA